MSAFDIAGAVVATPLAVLFLVWIVRAFMADDREDVCASVCFAASTILWSAFCIARLCGASL